MGMLFDTLGFFYGIWRRGSNEPTVMEVLPTIPGTAITPGPQLTVLRSVKAPTPNAVAWASTGVLDFVADCGADPTGATDCAAAWETAREILTSLAADPRLPLSTLVLYFPPGIYSLNSALVNQVWNFATKGTSLTLRGAGVDASIIQFNGFDGPVFANVFQYYMLDLTFVGAQVPNALDCVTGLEVSVSYLGVIERCNFVFILSASNVLFLLGATWSVRNCTFSDVSSENAALGVLYSKASYIELLGCTFIDLGNLNGYPNVNKTSVNRCWFRHDDSPTAIGSGYQQRGVVIRGCIFDESCERNVAIVGGPTSNVTYVHVESTAFNPPILGSKLACLWLENVDYAHVEGMIDSGDPASDPVTPAINCVAVGTTKISKLTLRPGSNSDFITVDLACNYLRVEDSPSLLPENIQSSASTNEVQITDQEGLEVECRVGPGNAAIGSGLAVRTVAGGGYNVIATTDGLGFLAGVAVNVDGGADVLVARPGQVVTMMSDGAGSLAIGDPVTTLGAAVAGKVKKAVSTGTGLVPTCGICQTAQAAAGPVQVFLQIGGV